jgi:hypothetical protein
MKVATALFSIAALAGTVVAATDLSGSGVVVLDTSCESALSMVGNSTVQIPARAVYVNSSHSRAVTTSGSAVLDCPNLYIVGGAQFTGGSMCTGAVTQSCNSYQNPLATLSCAATTGAEPLGSRSISGGTVELSPGYYDGGISVTGNANVTFSPGIYLIGGSGLKITAGTIVGNNVCFMILSGEMKVAGASSVSMSPPASGGYAGMVIMQSSSNTTEMNLRGGSEINITGTIYAPEAKVNLVGNGSVEGQGPQMGDLMVSKRLSLAGTGTIKIGRPTSQAIQLPKLPLAD